MLCKIASGFYQECVGADPIAAERLASSSVLGELHRHSTTKHENNAAKTFQREGLSCPVKVDMVDIGLSKPHPMVRIGDMLETLALHGKLHSLWGPGQQDPSAVLPKFWRRYRQEHPSHQLFDRHRTHLHRLIPLQLHMDEGESLKNAGLMVASWQSPIGAGVATQEGEPDMPLNYLGNSFKTRYLISVLLKRVYLKTVKGSLDKLVSVVASDLTQLFEHGIELDLAGRRERFYIAWIGLKGDWPIQQKVGHLQRHFARATKDEEHGVGVCHLCLAGQAGVPMHDLSRRAAWKDTILTTSPFRNPGPLSGVPQTSSQEVMFRFDPFHTLHKGCFAELAGSALVGPSIGTP